MEASEGVKEETELLTIRHTRVPSCDIKTEDEGVRAVSRNSALNVPRGHSNQHVAKSTKRAREKREAKGWREGCEGCGAEAAKTR